MARHAKKVRKAVRENCREYVQNELMIASAMVGEISVEPERLQYLRDNTLTEYRLKNIIYFCVAEAIQPNFRSLEYPLWEDSRGEDLIDYYGKILAIYKMKNSTNRDGIRATEKRVALEDMLKTLYRDGRKDICTWINQSERLDYFRSGHLRDLPLSEIEKCLQTAEIRRTQEIENERAPNRFSFCVADEGKTDLAPESEDVVSFSRRFASRLRF